MENYFGFIYITTNTINGKKYIGKREFSHKGWNKYLGSGKLLKLAIKEHGIENFYRDIVYLAKNEEELKNMEIFFIKNHNAIKNENYYNVHSGGFGGKHGEYNEERKNKISQTRKQQDICWNRGKTGIYSEETIQKITDGAIKHYIKCYLPNGEIHYTKGSKDTMKITGLTRNLFYKLVRTGEPYIIKQVPKNKIDFYKKFVGLKLEVINKEEYLEKTSTTIS